jgi:Mn-containing catalase
MANWPPPQNSIQGWNCYDLERKDLLMDVGTEEMTHFEVVGSGSDAFETAQVRSGFHPHWNL